MCFVSCLSCDVVWFGCLFVSVCVFVCVCVLNVVVRFVCE